ncbi:MAG: phosphopantothenoylcysteine decarboxylase [Chlamydiae bacterium]|nr:phosphopantothenoylcysteine decarboxylase [Chlamydiota bacterium]MBI3277846.1 phosphopantothenoylcysteine decarboxylase [Chlamydiota bacterium]
MRKSLPRILVTAGPTREYLDPTRFISNPSSGKMGYLIAEEAWRLGCSVLLISGPTSLKPLPVKTLHVVSAREMFKVLQANFRDCDVLMMTAAVSDFRPKSYSPHKIKKEGCSRIVELISNPDILAWAGNHKGKKMLVGFAAQTERLFENAREKMLGKNLDLIVANCVGFQDRGFEANKIEFLILEPSTMKVPTRLWTKKKLAKYLVRKMITFFSEK